MRAFLCLCLTMCVGESVCAHASSFYPVCSICWALLHHARTGLGFRESGVGGFHPPSCYKFMCTRERFSSTDQMIEFDLYMRKSLWQMIEQTNLYQRGGLKPPPLIPESPQVSPSVDILHKYCIQVNVYLCTGRCVHVFAAAVQHGRGRGRSGWVCLFLLSQPFPPLFLSMP